jgi:hypothetical protein
MTRLALLSALALLLGASPALSGTTGGSGLSYLHEQVPFFTMATPNPNAAPRPGQLGNPGAAASTCVPNPNLQSYMVCGQNVRRRTE